jgi:hypothetical protein
LPEIHHDRAGFDALACLYAQAKGCLFETIEVDMDATSWFDADMCAAFGAILYRLGESWNTVRVVNVRPNVEAILSKNGFLSHYGRAKMPDRWGTTIPYQRFDAKDDRYFSEYIESELMRRPELPTMSAGLMKKFSESIFEIFSNAVLHSQTEQGIFSCGQSYPKRNRLDFSVADLGVGMRQNIKDHAALDLSPEAAIEWATQGRNTTKRGQIPGGLGLKLLNEFVDLNGGRIQIVSDAGYWQRERRKTISARLSHSFPGTVVNVEIDTSDARSYRLASELTEADIF